MVNLWSEMIFFLGVAMIYYNVFCAIDDFYTRLLIYYWPEHFITNSCHLVTCVVTQLPRSAAELPGEPPYLASTGVPGDPT